MFQLENIIRVQILRIGGSQDFIDSNSMMYQGHEYIVNSQNELLNMMNQFRDFFITSFSDGYYNVRYSIGTRTLPLSSGFVF
jgi:hypothetical protein